MVRIAIRSDVCDPQGDNVATTQLAVDRKVEKGKVAGPSFDQEPGFGFISNDPNAPAGSAALIDNMGNIPANTTIEFQSELPSYEIANIRWGIRSDRWEGGLFINNLFDERAFLALDRERGRRARVAYITNPPRTIGVNFRMNF